MAGETSPSLEALMPETFAELTAIFARLEQRYRDMQDIEFTIQNGKLWMLQTRNGKRTTAAALKIAVDMGEEGATSRHDAVMRIDAAALDQLLHPTIDPTAEKKLIASGLPASPGAASGVLAHAGNAIANSMATRPRITRAAPSHDSRCRAGRRDRDAGRTNG